MITAIIELGIGYFVTYKVPGILNLKKTTALVVKTIGILLLIIGFIELVEHIGTLLHLN